MFSLDGQVAIITGGAQGIGEGICKVFCKAGATVALWDVRDSGETTAENIKKKEEISFFKKLTLPIVQLLMLQWQKLLRAMVK